ncbi:MAG: zinc ABC transporter substrate-binding protein, partial [Planctomycetota bacterium]
MSRKLLPLSATAILMGGTALAEAPSVAVDIAPVHSLVARVMDGVGAPSLIVRPGASPHEYSLRPSEAAALQDADLVFWIGEDLTPWMEDAVETLATDATVTALLEADGIKLLDFREGALFEAHEHGDHDDEEHAAHDDHDDHGH